MDECHFLAIAAIGILTAFQHTSIATLEAEGKHIERHIRTGLIDHANDTKGDTDTTKTETVGQRLLFGNMSKW